MRKTIHTSVIVLGVLILLLLVPVYVGADRSSRIECVKEVYKQEEKWADVRRLCKCISNKNGGVTLNCRDECETCDPVMEVCGIRSFFATFRAPPADGFLTKQVLHDKSCFDVSNGPFKGHSICLQCPHGVSPWFLGKMHACRLSVDGVVCNKAEEVTQQCHGRQYVQYVVANCAKTAIGHILDECDDSRSTNGLLRFLVDDSASVNVGSCGTTSMTKDHSNSTTMPNDEWLIFQIMDWAPYGFAFFASLTLVVLWLSRGWGRKANGYEQMASSSKDVSDEVKV